MPELPEVESVSRALHQLIAGKRIVKAQLLRPGLAPDNPPRQFALWLKGGVVNQVSRRGKHILAHLSNGRTLITHLRMTGRFLYVAHDAEQSRHAHAVFWLDDGKKLLFEDHRHFGMMMLARTTELDQVKYLAKLAPEPFSQNFSPEYLYDRLKRSQQPLKLALLDQTKVLGLGNIYAAEALHRAGINPRLVGGKISKLRAARLYSEIVAVLSEAIANHSSFDSQTGDPQTGDLDTSYGKHELIARVYEREGQPCLTCSAQIRRFTQGSRSTYYCPRCQRR